MTAASAPTPAALSLRDYGPSRGSHAHDHFQVLVALQGVLSLDVEGRGRRLAAGQGFVVAPGDRHDFEAEAGASRCLVLDTRDAAWTTHAGRAAQGPHAAALASFLGLCLSQPQPPALALAQAPLLLCEAWSVPASSTAPAFATAAAEGTGTTVPRGFMHPGSGTPTGALDRGLPRGRPIDWAALSSWVAAHWHRPLGVEDLAARAFLSPSQFAQRCRDERGLSPLAWLRALRLAEARRLRASGLAVAETARRTGYRSPSALTAALRREGGWSA
ncbi:AraC family transcriptional regulator [uncultured Pseudacidovorax sp.]|uniref:AraC family transcriptional regulator n=1 Tax=uncultured Pseudacidovorax sp. TaxID=679313 RepID=UPI0025CCB77C|nr:AraC family transcriptional regulator [uncultured Pseudacidovorax sp.]